ncbi:MAG: hypothetical protein COS99_06050 [Candidatus Omnitrophica bacterium CG07_land_8_20_14_0_80_42_15]|uniref:MEMO1 family protein COS99_06050 n=1 Tax=Candidatus Aquitaenariimonas noxiae TaxID=1974741 RepID=A0A2J0KZT6_9BACT|nr:MAG: hypothetical protein COS99_06050 [Candidatus Omnitrophica bacterium CG07_land_8_20_14_0_80_42_15]
MKIAKCLVLSLFLLSFCVATASAEVKQSDLAGSWYPGTKEELSNQINYYLDQAGTPKIDGKIIAIISPHAGLQYSGPVAAYSYKAVAGMAVDTVVVIGFSHKLDYDGVAVFDREAYGTPLGVISTDMDVVKKLTSYNKKITSYPAAFEGENSIELEIPFLQSVLKDFKLVMVAIGEQTEENDKIIADALYNALKDKDKILLVGSTDLHHFFPYDETNKIDKSTVDIIKAFDPARLYSENILAGGRLMCGPGAVCATMTAAKELGADKLEVLKYANSGDTAGDKTRVVGYVSAVMYKSNQKARRFDGLVKEAFAEEAVKKGETQMLSEDQKKRLLQIARDTIETYIKTGKIPDFKEDDPVLNREMGAFVTLHYKGELRGCIGNIVGRGPLYKTVRDMAIESSTGDPRFPPVTSGELKDIDVEISVLSELEKISDPSIIEMGKHGVLVRSGFRSGVFLPQVATETGWTRDEFMSNLCTHKAGLAPDAWKKSDCDIYIFTAEVFREK